MKKKPEFFNYLSFYFMWICMGFPMQVFFLYDYKMSEFGEVFNHLSIPNWITMGFLVICSVLAYRVSGYLRWSMVFLCSSLLVNNFYVGLLSTEYSLMITTFSSGMFLIPIVPILFEKNLALLRSESEHWWKTPFRLGMQMNLEINLDVGSVIYGKTLNISSTGALIEIKKSDSDLISDIIPIILKPSQGEPFHCRAQIVRSMMGQQENVQYLGIAFTEFDGQGEVRLHRELKEGFGSSSALSS